MSNPIEHYLNRLQQTDSSKAEQAKTLGAQMLELWATAEFRPNNEQWSKPLPHRAENEPWAIRVQRVLHPLTHQEVLTQLSQDRLEWIARLATARLAQQAPALRQPVTLALLQIDLLEEASFQNGFVVTTIQETWGQVLHSLVQQISQQAATVEELYQYLEHLPPNYWGVLAYSLDEDADFEFEPTSIPTLAQQLLVNPQAIPLDDDHEQQWGPLSAGLLDDLLQSALAPLPLPLHPSFTDDEAERFLQLATNLSQSELLDWQRFLLPALFVPELIWETKLVLPFGLWGVYSADVPGSWGAVALSAPWAPEGWGGAFVIKQAIEAVWPGRYELELRE